MTVPIPFHPFRGGRAAQLPCIQGHLLALILVLLLGGQALALEPQEILVLANRNAAKSQGLASSYMAQRGIPPKNQVLLWITDQETCTREDYNKRVVPPVRRFLAAHPEIRAIVTFYGLPIRIAPRPNEPKDENSGAAFDSELTLVKHRRYDLNQWQPNPFYLGFKDRYISIPKEDVMMVSRLDGPSPEIVRRIVEDSIFAEKNGLSGKAYFDARWPMPDEKQPLAGYAFYDASLHKTARHHREKGLLPVVLNQAQTLFAPGTAPDTALYCGWYSLSNYIPAFQWNRGSVGFHMASGECTTLRGNGNIWCKRILENGAAATLGPVSEPYIQSFPVPELFFNLLTEGILTLAETYMVSLPYLSWQMMLVGDPLYRVHLSGDKGS